MSEFYSDKRSSVGVTGRCKVCISECKKLAYDPVKNAERSKKWREANKTRAYKLTRAWKSANPDRVAASDKKYRDKHKEREAKRVAEYAKANPEKGRERALRYQKRNPAKVAAAVSKRRSMKLQRYAGWDRELTDFVAKEASALARMRGESFGFHWHVDHAIPLAGTSISGLHVWNNFQVIPALVNQSKGNKFEVAA